MTSKHTHITTYKAYVCSIIKCSHHAAPSPLSVLPCFVDLLGGVICGG